MTIAAAVILGLLTPLLVFDAARRPTIRRLAVRNIIRRPGEAALVVAGSLLATALITASFIIGDSFGASIRGVAEDRWGPTDELVFVDGVADLAPTVAAIAAADPAPGGEPLFDGLLPATLLTVAVEASAGTEPAVEPSARVLEVAPATAVAFAGPDTTGGLDTLGPAQAVLNERLADDLGVAAGDTVTAHLGGAELDLTVAAVAPASGINGFAPVLVAEGAITGLAPDPDLISRSAVFVSNRGDTYQGAELTDEAVAAISSALGPDADIAEVKAGLLQNAEAEAADMTELFGTIGGFSVAAGILLVVNLFVMLAGERKSELGTLRAVGLRRGHLVRAFTLEGAVYGVLAAIGGVAVGIGLAAVVMTMAGDLLESEITIRLDIVATSLVSGALIGLMVSQVTVLVTSWRLTRLNIVRAIKDLPEPRRLRRRWRALAVGTAGVGAAIGLLAAAGDNAAVTMVAPVLGAVAAIPLLQLVLPRRGAVLIGCGAGLVWAAAVFGVRPNVMADPDISLFLLQGLVLVALATAMVATLDRLWIRGAGLVSGGGIASRLGLAEPLARPARSSLLVAMYALVIFTITFMLVMNVVFQGQNPDFARRAGGAYDLLADTSRGSGVTAETLAARPDVAHAAPVHQGAVAVRADDEDDRDRRWWLSGIETSFLDVQPPALSERLDRFADDDEVWSAVLADEGYVIIDKEWGLAPGDTYQFGDGDGSFDTFTVAGLADVQWMVDTEVMIAVEALHRATGDGDRPPTRFHLVAADDADPDAVARSLTADGVRQGVDARTFLSVAEAETAEQEGFLNLLQVYMGLGLLIGIAGLGVVMIRAVRERRRQFGVMRALGVASPVIRRAFVVEASFVAVQGVALGIGLGVLSSWQILTQSTAFEEGLTFRLPVSGLAVLAVGCLAASLAMAAVPAVRAGRVHPVSALRLAT